MTAKPIEMTVSFDDADGENIVFFGNYFRLAHRALEQWLPQVGIPWSEWFKNKEWGVPLRHVEADYLQPMRPGDRFSVNIRVAELGDSSVHFDYDFRGSDNKSVARVKTSHVFVERGSFKKVPVPDNVRTVLARDLAGS
jgi:YbgC/YbaW family acyl-CoA thioester hydrolase